MIIYNVTIKIDWTIHDAWLAWMQQVHIPELVATGCFTRSQLVRLLDTDERKGPHMQCSFMPIVNQTITGILKCILQL